MYDLPQYLLNGIPIRLNVKQGQFLIVPKTESLTTAGLATCSGLAMIIGTKKFLTHLDAATDIVPIISAINNTLTEENMTSANIDEIRVWQGIIYGRNHALNKVDRILEAIGIKNVVAKSLGSRNPINVAKATLNALLKCKDTKIEESHRGVSISLGKNN